MYSDKQEVVDDEFKRPVSFTDHIHGRPRLLISWPQQSEKQLSQGHEEADGWLSEEEERGAPPIPTGEEEEEKKKGWSLLGHLVE